VIGSVAVNQLANDLTGGGDNVGRKNKNDDKSDECENCCHCFAPACCLIASVWSHYIVTVTMRQLFYRHFDENKRKNKSPPKRGD
jgi:hypothetical protein